MQSVMYLALGWVIFLVRVLPDVTVSWLEVFAALFGVALFTTGLHRFLDWWYRQCQVEASAEAPEPRPWRWGWTGAITGVTVLMFVAGIAAVGVTHQVVWVATSKGRLVERGVERGRMAAGKMKTMNNLKQIGYAVHYYHENEGNLPPAETFDERGRMLHGWHTFLLPYIEQENLYRRIKLDRPWSDPANAEAFRAEIQVYQDFASDFPTTGADGYALSHFAANIRLLGGERGRKLSELEEGAANTIRAGQIAAGPKPWGYPANARDPKLGINRSPHGFGSASSKGAAFLMADGSVRFIANDVDDEVLRRLGTFGD